MFATIRRHQKWLWAAIIAVIIPSFVVFFTPDATLPSLGSRGAFGSVFGKPITQEQAYGAYRETELDYLFNFGTWPNRDEANRFGYDLETESRARILMVEELRRFGVYPSEDAAAQWVSTVFRDRRQGVYRQELYDQFVRQAMPEHGLSERDLERFALNQVGIRHLVSLVGMNGKMVTPKEAEVLYRKQNEQFETEAVVFSMTNYLANVKVDTNDLAKFYTNRMAVYRLPERVQVRYVRYDVTNFLADAQDAMAKDTNLVRRIDAIYAEQGANYFTDTNGTPLPPDAAKGKIREREQRRYAMQAALRKASLFAIDLFKMTPVAASNLNLLAATNNLTVKITEPFNSYDGPATIRVLDNFTKAAFALTPDEPFAQPLVGEDGVYLIALDQTIPKEDPPFALIQARVAEDFRRSQALTDARNAGIDFHNKLTNSLAQGKTFNAVCEAEKIKPIVVPKFTPAARELTGLDSSLELSALKDQVADLQAGKASHFTPSREGGFVLFLKARSTADEATMKKDMPEFLKNLRQSRIYECYMEWRNREIQLAHMSQPEPKESKEAKKPAARK